MNKITCLFLSLAALSLVLSCNPTTADQLQMQQLVPDVPHQRVTPKTFLYSRSQMKYDLSKTDYLARWIDQPLFVDGNLTDTDPKRSYPSFVKMQQIAKEYGLGGFAFFPQTSGRTIIYEYAERSKVPGFTLLNELTADGAIPTSMDEVVKLALASPQSLRINGKLVFTSYRADIKPVEYWQKELAGFRAKYGDQFIFLPDVGRWDGQSLNTWRKKYDANKITPEDIAGIKKYLRQWANATDGLYYAGAASFQNSDHTYDVGFYEDFVIRIMKSVLAEPQFKGKLLGLSAVVGHTNVTRVGVTLSSQGTKTLRDSMDAAMSANPDIINIPEWDEQNENTSLRPTVYNGTSSMRLIRYYAAKLNDEKLAPIPSDNASIPNLIISYRKTLVLGEKLKLELVDVPDGAKSTSYTAQLNLKTMDGKNVYSSPVQSFAGDTMQAHTLIIPSETLSQYEVLRPQLVIESNGHKSTFEDGLHYIDLRSTWNWDYKWVKQPLRDLMPTSKVLFQVGDKNADGTRTVTADFETNEPLARVQVLDNDAVIYGYSPERQWREDAENAVLRFSWQSMQSSSKGLELKGGITLQNAEGNWFGVTANNQAGEAKQGATFPLDGQIASVNPQWIYLSIPKAQLKNASLKIDIAGVYQGTISVQQILDKTLYGIPGPNSFNMVISRYLRQDHMETLTNTQKVKFSVPVLPDLPNSVLHLQAVGVSGHLYRSKPVVLGTSSSAMKNTTVFSATKDAPISVPVQSQRVPDIKYQFNPDHGSVLIADTGRPFWAILGGYFALATGRGGGARQDATSFVKYESDYPKDATQSAPTWVHLDDGNYALQFDGKGTYISLPQGVIPRRAAFTISMDIKPDSATGKQMIIANQNYYPGSIAVYTEDGVLKADYKGRPDTDESGLDSGLKLPIDKWSHLVIRYDQAGITFEVDGKASKKFAAKGPGLYDTASVVGGFGADWFKGQIKSLEIEQGVG